MPILDSLKPELRQTLPAQIQSAIKSYEQFAACDSTEDAKTFAAHHSACKAAIAHIEALLKLARWTDSEESMPKPEPDTQFTSILAEAQEQENEYEDPE